LRPDMVMRQPCGPVDRPGAVNNLAETNRGFKPADQPANSSIFTLSG
jgi:hypothetical protein